MNGLIFMISICIWSLFRWNWFQFVCLAKWTKGPTPRCNGPLDRHSFSWRVEKGKRKRCKTADFAIVDLVNLQGTIGRAKNWVRRKPKKIPSKNGSATSLVNLKSSKSKGNRCGVQFYLISFVEIWEIAVSFISQSPWREIDRKKLKKGKGTKKEF